MSAVVMLLALILGFIVGGPIGLVIALALCVVLSFTEVIIKLFLGILNILFTYPVQVLFIIACFFLYAYAVSPDALPHLNHLGSLK
jgi:hypothetical protein